MTEPDQPTIALVTCADHPALPPDDRLLVPALARRGLGAVPALWDDPAQRWEAYAAVVLRSCWDYHHHAEAFERWLERLERGGARVHNAVPTLRWNMRKTYLRDLKAAGVPVLDTFWAPRGSDTTLRGVAAATGWGTMVVKPTVSASAHDTWVVDAASPGGAEARFARELAARDLMVQAFVRSIPTEGELSLVFIAGAFSHAVRKRPKPGDFRVQEEHGGSAEAVDVPADLVRQAERAPRLAPRPPLYARVDGTFAGGRLVVTELELIEPTLYLGLGGEAADAFAAAIEAVVTGEGGR